MGWKIDDGRPIWTQLKEQMIKRIVSGTSKRRETTKCQGSCRRSRGESEYDAESVIST